MNFTVSIALVFNQYVNPIALEKLGWKYYVRILLPKLGVFFSQIPFNKLGRLLLLDRS